jgi:hypothetical protein
MTNTQPAPDAGAPSATPPASQPWWEKFTSRKFLLTVVALAAVGLGIYSQAIPWGWPAAAVLTAIASSWVATEGLIDLRAIKIPDVPGPWDDVARNMLQVAQSWSDAQAQSTAAADQRAQEKHAQALRLEQEKHEQALRIQLEQHEAELRRQEQLHSAELRAQKAVEDAAKVVPAPAPDPVQTSAQPPATPASST